MTNLLHKWPRFWVPLGKPVPLDQAGFLYDPEDEHAHYYYSDYHACSLDQLSEHPAAILLGEPGIGKSTTLKEEFLHLQAEGQPCLYRELNQYQSDTRLIDDIFDSEEVRLWLQGNHRLTLLLDSLDECSLTIRAVAKILAGQLKRLPRERLSLRLTCRTADWPTHFTDELRELWLGDNKNAPDPLGVFELAPLRRKDIHSAAQDRGLDADAFLAEVHLNEIQPLASHPNTLNMLLGLFGRPDGLPRQRAEIYRLGCETLASERNPFRKVPHHACKLSARQRMAVAGRIAAQMIFAHRSTIWRGDSWAAETADLLETDIVGDVEQADGLDFPVDPHALRETIECALFSGRSEKRIGFAHQSYAEFLAAWHVHSRCVDAQRVLALLRHSDDGRIPPQHAESAIWLAALNGNIFTALVKTEPLLLLHTDLSDTNAEQKAQLTAKLLSSFAARTEFDMDWGLRQHYRKLAFPDLGAQLSSYIVDKEMFMIARRAAMGIATACNVRELADLLIVIALDQEEEYQQRLNAADAAAHLADAHQLSRLRPLALGESGEDPEDRLKAAVIPSLWPAHISTKEIFELLLQLQNVRCLGMLRYSPEEFVSQITNNDLSIALHWISETQRDYETDHLKDAIMAEARNRLDDPCVLSAFAKTAWACLDRHEGVFNRRGEREDDSLIQDDNKRRNLITVLLEAHSDSDNKYDPIRLIYGNDRIVLPQDAYWLLEYYQTNSDPVLRIKLAQCIVFFVRYDAESAWLDAVISAACADALNIESPLADVVAPCLKPIYLDSEIAHTLKTQHVWRMKQKQERPRPLDPPPSVRVEGALQEFESGKNDAWMRLWQELSLPDEATYYPQSRDNVTTYPGWQRATMSERTRIVRCAETWAVKERLTHEDIFGTDNSTSYRHISTYLALCLLADETPQTLASAPPENWDQWAEAIVAYPFDDKPEPRESLLRLAYTNAPGVVLETFRRLIERDISATQSLHRVRELATIWDGRIAELLHEFLAKPDLTLEQTSTLLDALLEHDDESAFEFACNTVTSRPLVGPPNQPLALVAAQSLVAHQTRKCWQIVWGEMLADSVFGERLMLGLAYHSGRGGNLYSGLSEQQIVDLYFWLEEHFPTATDIRYPSGKVHSVTAREELERLRDHFPSYLSGLGTPSAVEALHTICEQFPDWDWLKYQLIEAKQTFRKATLQSLSPAELIAYTHRRDARLARSSAELMEAVLVSLQRFQEKLHGQTPLAPFLWDMSVDGKSDRPKNEDRLTDFLKHHLEGDLPTFVIDREVQIRNLKEHGIGERTDLKIEAKDHDGRSLSVIIESKGCWNNGLLTAMQSQLVERYLKLAPEACGIYLVGWFRCERWEGKRGSAFKGTKEELINTLKQQSQTLSNSNGDLSAFVLDVSF